METSIDQLLKHKDICILCPTTKEKDQLYKYLYKCKNLKWKSGACVWEFDSMHWGHYQDSTVYIIRNNKEFEFSYILSVTSQEFISSKSDKYHIFTVAGYILYLDGLTLHD